MGSRRPGLCVTALGSPAAPEAGAIRPWLRQFLSDPKVLRMPSLARRLLLETVILPFRPARAAHAYQSIWDPERGSPLVYHTKDFAAGLQELLRGAVVRMGMRYGEPSMEKALTALLEDGCDPIHVLPCYPQWADSTTGSTEAAARRWAAACGVPVSILPVFFEEAGFIAAETRAIAPLLAEDAHLLLSYHGLPESHIRREDPESLCLSRTDCCADPGVRLARCYRAQCFATSRAIRSALDLPESRCTTAFQSRFGPVRWIGPATADLLPALARRGVRRLVVACPSFTADCLETLEEIGMRGKQDFLAAGGEHFALAPAPNADPLWIRSAAAWLAPQLGLSTPEGVAP